MKVVLSILAKDEWATLSENAHLVTFAENRPSNKDRIDYCILAHDEQKTPIGYITVKELDRDSAYWQFGGSFPGYRGTNIPFHAYTEAAKYCEKKYKRLLTYIENVNTPMLRFAMKIGFRVIGVKIYGKKILLEHMLEF